MPWWETVLFVMALAVAIWGFVSIVGLQTRRLTRRTDRTAEDLYRSYADSAHNQHRPSRAHDGQWQDDEPA
jgi:type II secretory pathway component PulL